MTQLLTAVGGPQVGAAGDSQGNAAVTGVRRMFRDEFGGSGGSEAINAELWEVEVGSGMAVAVGGSRLAITTGTEVSSVTTLTSRRSYQLPLRAMLAFQQSAAKQTGQAVRLELVAVKADGTLDEDNLIRVETPIAGVAANQYGLSTVCDGVVEAATTYTAPNITTLVGMMDLSVDWDQAVAASAVANSATRTARAYRDKNLPDPNARYKVRVSVVHSATFAGSSLTVWLDFALLMDLTEVQVEVTGSRGAGDLVQVAGTVAISGTPAVSATETALLTPTQYGLTGTASTNAVIARGAAATLYALDLFNPTAATVYLKLFNKASAPTLGTDVPVLTVPLAAGGILVLEWGRVGRRFNNGIAVAITAAAADLDATAVAAGVRLGLSYV